MIHTFSITIETYPSDDNLTSEDIAANIIEDITGAWEYYTVDVQPITGIQRQHLIGETDND